MEKKESNTVISKKASNEKVDDQMKKSDLHQFFIAALKDIYYAEHALVDGLENVRLQNK